MKTYLIINAAILLPISFICSDYAPLVIVGIMILALFYFLYIKSENKISRYKAYLYYLLNQLEDWKS